MKYFEKIKKHNIFNIENLLSFLYPNYDIRGMLDKGVDKRYYFDFFINQFNIPKEQFFNQLKSKLNINYKAFLDEFDKEDIKAQIKNLEIARKYSFFPIIKNNKVKEIVTSNPFEVIDKFNIDESVNLYIALGRDISSFIDTLSIQYLDDKKSIFLETLRNLIVLSEKKNISKIMFENVNKEVFYSYQEKNDEWKKGKIINQDLTLFWQKLKNNFFENLEDDKFFKIRKIKINNLNNIIILEWNIPKQIIYNMNNIGVVLDNDKNIKKIQSVLESIDAFVYVYKNFNDLYNDYKKYKFKVTIFYINKALLKRDKEVFKQKSFNVKKIFICSAEIDEVECYKLGADYYIKDDFSVDYLKDIIRGFLQ